MDIKKLLIMVSILFFVIICGACTIYSSIKDLKETTNKINKSKNVKNKGEIIINMNNNFQKNKFIIAGGLVLIMFFVLCTTTIGTGFVGIKTTFGKVEKGILTSGLHFKLPYQKINKLETREIKLNIETLAFSKDIQEVKVNIATKYKIKQDKAIDIFLYQGKNYCEKTIEPAVLGSLKSNFTNYNAENLVSNRQLLTKEIFDDLYKILDKNNIILLEVTLQDIDFSDAFTNAVEAKQVATQDKLKAEQEAEKKKIDADGNAYVKIKEAEAEAQANNLKQKSLTPELIEYEKIQKWNGILPQVSGSATPIISIGK